jgi:hypothetical protein
VGFAAATSSMMRATIRSGACLLILLIHVSSFAALPVAVTGGFGSSLHKGVGAKNQVAQFCNCSCKAAGNAVCRCACCKRSVTCTCGLSSSDEQSASPTLERDAILPVRSAMAPVALLGRNVSQLPCGPVSPPVAVLTPPPEA